MTNISTPDSTREYLQQFERAGFTPPDVVFWTMTTADGELTLYAAQVSFGVMLYPMARPDLAVTTARINAFLAHLFADWEAL